MLSGVRSRPRPPVPPDLTQHRFKCSPLSFILTPFPLLPSRHTQELLTGSSFFCIQLYFLLGFSSRGRRMSFRLSIKGAERASMSIWVLAANRLSKVGRAGKQSAPAAGDSLDFH